MKTIPFEKAYKLIEDASAVIVDESVLVYPSLVEPDEDQDALFLFLDWENEDGVFEERFRETENRTVRVADGGTGLVLVNTRGEPTELRLLQPVVIPD